MSPIRDRFFRVIGKALLIIIILTTPGLFLPQEAHAASITWDGGGGDNNWSTGANWSGDTSPGISDIAVFDGTSTKDVTIDVSIDVAGIDINSGYTGTMTQGSGNTITVGTDDFDISDGSFVGGDSLMFVDDAFTISGGSFTSTTGELQVDGDFTISSGSFDPSTGTLVATGPAASWDVQTSETLYNFTIDKNNLGNLNFASGDTLIVTEALALTDGNFNTGTIDARKDILQHADFDGGSGVIKFGDDGVVQTFTVQGGETPVIELDSAADANDVIDFDADAEVRELRVTSGFSGTIPISNPSDFTPTFNWWNQAAGTYDASAQTAWIFDDLDITGGTFTAPTTVTADGGNVTWDIGTLTLENFVISKNFGSSLALDAADTIIVTEALTLEDGNFNTGTIDARKNITQNAAYDGGTGVIEFGDDGVAQTYTIQGGETPVIELDSAADANDLMDFDAAAEVRELRVTSGFSGTIPISNPSDFTPTFNWWNQAAGTYDASAQTSWIFDDFDVTGGTFVPPTTVTADGSNATWDVGTFTFENFVISKNFGAGLTLDAADTIIVTEALTLEDGNFNTGTIDARKNITQNAAYDGGTGVIEFGDDGVAQTYTVQGGETPVVEFDSAADANDVIDFDAAAEVREIRVTSGFSGTIPISNPSDFLLSIFLWNQEAGTYDASAQTEWEIREFDISGGSFTAPALVTANGSTYTWNIATSQQFADFTIAKPYGGTLYVGTGTLVVTGDLNLTDGRIGTNSGGVLEARGDVTVASTWDAGSGYLQFGGSATQTFDLTGATDKVNEDIIVNKSGGVVNLASDFTANASYQDFTIQEGMFHLNGYNLAVNGSNGTASVEDGGVFSWQGGETLSFNGTDPDFQTGSTARYTGDGDAAADTYTITDDFTDTFESLIFDSTDGATDTFDLGAAIDLPGDFTLTAGTFETNGNQINLEGDWSNSGTFSAESGTVVMDGTGQSISGSTTFYNFTKTVASADTLTFTASATQTFTGTLTLNGAFGQLLSLRSSIADTQTQIDPQGSRSLTYLDVKDNNNINATIANCTNGCISSGNNTNWALPGFTVSTISGNTTEAGGTATFTVVLTSAPSDDVFIPVSSSDTTEGTVSTSTLTFTNGNWSDAQTVTVTGVNDDLVDGDIAYTIVLGTTSSSDSAYHGIDVDDVSVTNENDDTAGATVSTISGDTTEAGGTATFTVVLISQPTDDVVIPVSSDDTSEGTVSPASLTFTNGNWSDAQTVTVTGVDDALEDGNIAYNIVLGAATSSDGAYSGLDPSDVSVTNIDDDGKGITVSAISGNTTEAGGTATFTVVLDALPTDDVTIGLSSSDTTEGTVSPSTLTFTTGDWSDPQTVTVTGVNDDVDDGDIVYSIITAAASSTDSGYNGLNAADVSVTNTDNDTAGFTISSISGNTTEAGGTATFTVRLSSLPSDDVSIGLSSSDTGEGTVSPTTLTFTTGDWSDPQTVTVTGVDDSIFDGNIVYSIVTAAATSTDGDYNGLNPSDVSVTNTDDDVPGFTVSAISGDTTEAGGTATFTVVLDSQPSDDVVIGVSSSDTTEGTVSPSTLTFTNGNWSDAQTVTVTGVNDDVDDGDIGYTIILAAATSSDGNYNGLNPDDVSVTNTDDDASSASVSAISGNTTEAGGTATFTVVLLAQPSDDVVIPVSSDDTGEGTVSPSSLTFTNGDWDTPQTVTVTGVDDDLDDGDIAYTIVLGVATSSDGNYNGMDASDVSATNTDDDMAGVTVSLISGDTTEIGGTATFTVVLDAQPAFNVVIGVSTSDATEGTASTSTLTFTNGNWSDAQTVTVTGVNDDVDDGDIGYTILLGDTSSVDSAFNNLTVDDVSVSNTDDDTRGITVSAISGNTTEAGGTATFTIVLDSEPTDDVSIVVVSADTGEGTASPANPTFTSADWDTPQTITVTGVDDDVDDGDVVYSITLAPAVSADTNYNELNPADVSVTNVDDDTGGITVSAISGNTTESGGTATFTVVLDSQPTDDVTIGVSSSDTTEGTVSPSTLTFTNANWSDAQTVTVTGVADSASDGDVVYTIVLAAASSLDSNYDGLNPSDVTVTNENASSGNSDTDPSPSALTLAVDGVESCSANGSIVLKLTAANAQAIVVSNNDNYIGAEWQAFVPNLDYPVVKIDKDTIVYTMTLNWELDPEAEEKIVYVRFRSASGEALSIQSQPIHLGSLSQCDPNKNKEEDKQLLGAEGPDLVSVGPGSYIRGETFSTVYYIDEYLYRHPFYNEQTYFTYYDSFDLVEIVSDDQLKDYPLSMPVLPKPTAVLVKVQSSPKVYYAEQIADGSFVLHWIPDEESALNLIGESWADYVIDMPPTVWERYQMGDPVSEGAHLDIAQMKTRQSIQEVAVKKASFFMTVFKATVGRFSKR